MSAENLTNLIPLDKLPVGQPARSASCFHADCKLHAALLSTNPFMKRLLNGSRCEQPCAKQSKGYPSCKAVRKIRSKSSCILSRDYFWRTGEIEVPAASPNMENGNGIAPGSQLHATMCNMYQHWEYAACSCQWVLKLRINWIVSPGFVQRMHQCYSSCLIRKEEATN